MCCLLTTFRRPFLAFQPEPVRSLKDSFSGVERENEELRNRIASGHVILEVDPSLVDPSPLTDRFVDDDGASFEALKTIDPTPRPRSPDID